jgi:hypothetical protein
MARPLTPQSQLRRLADRMRRQALAMDCEGLDHDLLGRTSTELRARAHDFEHLLDNARRRPWWQRQWLRIWHTLRW